VVSDSLQICSHVCCNFHCVACSNNFVYFPFQAEPFRFVSFTAVLNVSVTFSMFHVSWQFECFVAVTFTCGLIIYAVA